jgi:hypothetical protein
MMALSKKDDLGRKWRSFVRHIVFLMEPTLLTIIATLLWVILWTNGIHFSENNEGVVLGVAGMLAVIFMYIGCSNITSHIG